MMNAQEAHEASIEAWAIGLKGQELHEATGKVTREFSAYLEAEYLTESLMASLNKTQRNYLVVSAQGMGNMDGFQGIEDAYARLAQIASLLVDGFIPGFPLVDLDAPSEAV